MALQVEGAACQDGDQGPYVIACAEPNHAAVASAANVYYDTRVFCSSRRWVTLKAGFFDGSGARLGGFELHFGGEEEFDCDAVEVRDQVDAAAPGAWAVVARLLPLVVDEVLPGCCYILPDALLTWLSEI